MSEEITTIVDTAQEAAKLYAGKFKSVEELENGYKQSLPLYQKNKELEDKLKQREYIPDDYSVPESVAMRDTQINELKKLAKSAGLNDEQFSRPAISVNENIKNQMQAFEARQESIGEEKINLAKSFVDNKFSGFSDDFRSNMINQIIMDDNTMNDALRLREQDLNSSVPGSSRTTGSPAKTDQMQDARAELLDLAQQTEMRPNDMHLRKKYISKAEEVGQYRKELSR